MDKSQLPRHIAIIMDGNGRWARQRGMPRVEGHRRGVTSVRKTVEKAASIGIEVLSLFCFSTENWRRPRTEIKFLMDTFLTTLFAEEKRILKNNIRFKLIGDKSKLNDKLVNAALVLEEKSSKNTGMWLLLAINYGGRDEIIHAIKAIVDEGIPTDDITIETVSRKLYTVGLPDPDLVIRTSGEMRLSNYMIWQCAYSELVFLDKFWPDFTEDDLIESIEVYKSRNRRFGDTGSDDKESGK